MELYKKGLDDVKTFILKYHYPFILDLNTMEDMVDTRQKMRLMNPLNLLLKLFSGLSGGEISVDEDNNDATIVKHLLNDIDHSLEEL